MLPDMCEVYLCVTDVNFILGFLSHVSSSSSCGCGRWWSKHWALAFDYGKDNVVICDARNVGGMLQGSKNWMSRRIFEQSYKQKNLLGCCFMAERSLDNILKHISHLEEAYHVVKNNCQNWVKHVLQMLGINIPLDNMDSKEVGVYIPFAEYSILGENNMVPKAC